MNVLITHVYTSDNKGDAAILSVLIADIRVIFPKANISILAFDKVPYGTKFEGIPTYQSFMGLALTSYNFKPIKLAYSFYIIAMTLMVAALSKVGLCIPLGKSLDQTFKLYQEADLVIGVGGGYLRGQSGLISSIELLLQLHPIFLSSIQNQKVVLYSQSVGPFANAFQKWVAEHALRHVSLIMAREDITVRLLKKLKITRNVIRSIDSGFFFKETNKVDLHNLLKISRSRKIIGITVRKWLPMPRQAVYENSLAYTADNLTAEGHAIVFIPQVTSSAHSDDDRIISRRVYERMNNKEHTYLIEKRLNHQDIKNLYSGLDFLIGTRFHSVIFSLTSHVPALAIEYEHKTSGIMHDLGLDKWVIKIEDVTEKKLKRLIKSLLREERSYHETLKKNIPPYIQKSFQAKKLLKEVLQ
jgi:colanic acid/amylovoran biosynthesis protein